MDNPIFVELIADDDRPGDDPSHSPRSIAAVLAAVAAIVLVIGGVSWLVGAGSSRREPLVEPPETGPVSQIPAPLRAAERHVAAPNGARRARSDPSGVHLDA